MEREIIVFQLSNSIKVEVVFEDATVWLTQQQMAELFERDISGINRHIKNVLKKGELKKESVCAKFANTASDGKTYFVDFYNLDMIISVGNRVKSSNINQFKTWAEEVIKSRTTSLIIQDNGIKNLIKVIRNQQVMLDRDIAVLFGVSTGDLNQAVKRNIERFPSDFMFQLTKEEFENWRSQENWISQIVTSNSITMGARKLPYAFTEHGISMLSGVLHSPIAIEANIRIMRAFVGMRHFINENAKVFQRIETIEFHQMEMEQHLLESDKKFDEIFDRLDRKDENHKDGIFFDGQIFDAYVFVTELIKKAKTEIILIDNYVDETVLNMFSKRNEKVKVTIYTPKITNQFQLDLNKYNAQYQPITVRTFNKSHDRFLIIDDTVYHVGASLKDLGKKWFAFSILNFKKEEIIGRLDENFLP